MGNGSEASDFHSSISKTNDTILGVVLTLFGIFSLSGNSMLLLVAYRKRSILKPAEFFIVNLAISDLGMTVTLFPLAIPSLFAHRWLFGKGTCKYYAFCGVFFGLCSLTNLTVLSSVCCMKVCYSAYGNKFSSSHSRVLLLCVWAYAFVFATAPLADWGRYGPEPYGTACCIDWKTSSREHRAMSYIVSLFVFCYIVPSVLIVISYTLILVTVKGARKAVQQHLSPHSKGSNVHSLIIKLSVAVCIGFLLAWTPYAIVGMWAVFGDAREVPPMVFALAAVFAKSSTLYNPMVYLLLKPNFLNVLTKDLTFFQTVCSMVCGNCRTLKPAAYAHQDARSPFIESRGCANTYECFTHYPQCFSLAQMDTGASAQPGNTTPPSSVHLVVYASRTRSAGETVEVTTESVPSPCLKDFL